jgi:hypothetical protein
MIVHGFLPDLRAYRRFVVAFSGRKDSLAAFLHLLSLDVPAHAIELDHHDVDGRGLIVVNSTATLHPDELGQEDRLEDVPDRTLSAPALPIRMVDREVERRLA